MRLYRGAKADGRQLRRQRLRAGATHDISSAEQHPRRNSPGGEAGNEIRQGRHRHEGAHLRISDRNGGGHMCALREARHHHATLVHPRVCPNRSQVCSDLINGNRTIVPTPHTFTPQML